MKKENYYSYGDTVTGERVNLNERVRGNYVEFKLFFQGKSY
jgi:hypothetical protein